MELKMTPYNHVYYKNCFYNPLLTGIYYCGGNDLPFLANDFFSYKINDQSILLLNTVSVMYFSWMISSLSASFCSSISLYS